MQEGDIKLQIDASYNKNPYWMDTGPIDPKAPPDEKRMCINDALACSSSGANARIGDCDAKEGTARDTTTVATMTKSPLVKSRFTPHSIFDTEQYSNLHAWNLKNKYCSTNPNVDSNLTAVDIAVNYSLKNTMPAPDDINAPYVTWMQEKPLEVKDKPLDQTLEDGVYLRHAFDDFMTRKLIYVPEKYSIYTPVSLKPYLSSATEDCIYNSYGRSYDRCKLHAYKANMREDELDKIRMKACCENRLSDVDPSVRLWCTKNYKYSGKSCQSHYMNDTNKSKFQEACCLRNPNISPITKNIGINYDTGDVYDDEFSSDACGDWLKSVEGVNKCKSIRTDSIKNIDNVKKACCANGGSGDYSTLTQTDFNENTVKLSDFNNYQLRGLCVNYSNDGLITCENGAPTLSGALSGSLSGISNNTLIYIAIGMVVFILIIIIFKRSR